ncbi:suppressor of fused domain protein [Yersinia similis]
MFKTNFIWVIPIYESEYEAIKENGIEYFDNLDDLTEISVVDVTREPFC